MMIGRCPISFWGLDWFVNRRGGGSGQVTTESEAGWTSTSWSRWQTKLSMGELESLYDDFNLVQAPCKMISQEIASAPLEIGKETNGEWQAEEDNELLKLFYECPVPNFSYQIFFERICLSMLLTGVAYIENRGKYLLPLIASHVNPEIETNGIMITKYKVGVRDVAVDDMIVTGFPSMTGYQNWMSPAGASLDQVFCDRDLWTFVGQTLNNQDITGGVIQLSEKYTEKQKLDFYERMTKERGRVGAGRARIVEGTYLQPQTLEKFDYSAFLKVLESRICPCYGLPTGFIGWSASTESNTYSNLESARQQYYENCLSPIWTKLQRAFTQAILGTDSELEFRFNVDKFSPNKDDELENKDETDTVKGQSESEDNNASDKDRKVSKD